MSNEKTAFIKKQRLKVLAAIDLLFDKTIAESYLPLAITDNSPSIPRNKAKMPNSSGE